MRIVSQQSHPERKKKKKKAAEGDRSIVVKLYVRIIRLPGTHDNWKRGSPPSEGRIGPRLQRAVHGEVSRN